jgi:two-component system sensor histidine kinase/response regulator
MAHMNRDPVTPTALRGARVLLVEDNDINQEIAKELLQDLGVVVAIAENGRVAVEMAQASFSLVLMDLQMPVMGGIEATIALRKNARLAQLPIVAMTASSMEQERQRCIDAGMCDFLAKPIDPDRLAAVLQRWIKPRTAASVAPQVPAGATPMAQPARAAPVLRPLAAAPVRPAAAGAPSVSPTRPPAAAGNLPRAIPGLDTALGLSRMAGKTTLYMDMLRRYAELQRHVPAQIEAAMGSGDDATAERLAHTLKGVSGSIGAVAVQALAAALEQAMKDGQPRSELKTLLEKLKGPLASLVRALQAQSS